MFSTSTPTSLNINTKSRLFDEASVVFGLFIGYLIMGSTRNQVDDYANLSIAYLCIQGRGIAAMIGTLSVVLGKFINNCSIQLQSIDIDPDTPEQELKQRTAIFKFLDNLKPLQYLIQLIAYLCLAVFLTTYCLGLYSLYRNELDFTFFGIIIISSVMVTIVTIIIIWYFKFIISQEIFTLTNTKQPNLWDFL